MITHVRERITGHFDAQSMDDKDKKGMEKDKYSYIEMFECTCGKK